MKQQDYHYTLIATNCFIISAIFEIQCYYCESFKINSIGDYKGHALNKHGTSMLSEQTGLGKAWAKGAGKELGE
jgi:hypothetical protein